MKNLIISVSLVVFCLSFSTCYHKNSFKMIFSGKEMASTERSMFTKEGRFFVSSGTSVYEVVKNRSDRYEYCEVAEGKISIDDQGDVPCIFTGLVAEGKMVYAACGAYKLSNNQIIPIAASIFRINIAKNYSDTTRVVSAPLSSNPAIFPNGMAIDKKGEIYIANSSSSIPGADAIIKVTISNTDDFTLSESPWLPAKDGGVFPNGIQVRGNSMYLSSWNTLYKISINRDGTAGAVTPVYAADPNNFLDDFAVLPGMIAVAEIDNPFFEPITSLSQITFVSLMSRDEGEVLDVISCADKNILPSSITLSKGGLFPTGSLLVTDFFNGGLYIFNYY